MTNKLYERKKHSAIRKAWRREMDNLTLCSRWRSWPCFYFEVNKLWFPDAILKRRNRKKLFDVDNFTWLSYEQAMELRGHSVEVRVGAEWEPIVDVMTREKLTWTKVCKKYLTREVKND